jgi:hypothetical protein
VLQTSGWDYLACTTEVHPIGTNNVTDFLPPQAWSQVRVCQLSGGRFCCPLSGAFVSWAGRCVPGRRRALVRVHVPDAVAERPNRPQPSGGVRRSLRPYWRPF